MSDPTDSPPRGVTNLRIKFRSASLDEFIARYAVDVSRGGIFIRTREPLSVGSRLKLDFQLLDAAPLLDGEGTVVWIRKPDPARPEVAPGMGVRFDRLSPQSDERLAEILAAKERLGQTGKVLGMSGTGGGMAVRRPTGTFPTVDPSAAPSPSPAEPAAGSTAGQPAAPAPESPRRSSTFATLARPAAGFGRPRSTTGGVSPLRSAPVPSSVFEPPTADDIDKALAVLEDKAAGPIPTTQPSSAEAAAPPAPVNDESSSEPTRVAELIEDGGEDDSAANEFDSDDAVTETRAAVLPESGAPDAPGSPVDDLTVRADLVGAEALEPDDDAGEDDEDNEATLAASPAAFATADKVLGGVTSPGDRLGATGAETGSAAPGSEGPSAPGHSVEGTSPSLAAGGVKSPFAKSPPTGEKVSSGDAGLFRADETYERPRKGGKWAVALLVLAAVGGGAYALRGRSGPPVPPPETAGGAAGAASPEPNQGASLADAAAAANTVAATADGSAAAVPTAAAPTEAKTAAVEPDAHAKDHKPADTTPRGKEAAAADEAHPKRKRNHTATGAAAGEPGTGTAGTSADEAKPSGQAAERGETKPSGERGETAGGASASAAAATPEPAAPASPTLRIVSAPSGAEVVIDGTSVGKTPLSIKDVDTATTHGLLLKKDGYEPAERAVSSADWTQSKSGATAKVTIKLRRVGADAPKDDSKKDGKPDVEIITPD